MEHNDGNHRLQSRFKSFKLQASSLLYEAICSHILEHPDVLDLMGDLPEEKQKPVLLFAALRYLVLTGRADELEPFFEAPNDRDLARNAGYAFGEFCEARSADLFEVMSQRSVQTNEVNRCIGLLPMLMTAHKLRRKPVALIELGASAGLNLAFDRYHYEYAGGPSLGPDDSPVHLVTELRGRVPRMDTSMPPVVDRIGIDPDPVDLDDEDSVAWLRACIWAGEDERQERLDAAIAMARADKPNIRAADVFSVLESTVAGIDRDAEVCLFSSWLMFWLSKEQNAELTRLIHSLSNQRRVWWMTLELVGSVPGVPDVHGVDRDGSVLGLQRIEHGSNEARCLGSIDPHGKWLDWMDDSTSAW